jgi:cytochrome b561
MKTEVPVEVLALVLAGPEANRRREGAMRSTGGRVGVRNTYGPTAKLLHWIIVVLLIAQYAIGWLMPDIRRGALPGTPMNVHMSIGFTVLVLIALRFLWRMTHPVAPESSLPGWQRVSSEGVHWLLYALVLVTTLTGWTFASMRGWRIIVFGALPLPSLTAQGSPTGHTIGEWHGTLIWVLLAAIGAHVLAALVHLFVYKDRIMHRMLPGRR